MALISGLERVLLIMEGWIAVALRATPVEVLIMREDWLTVN